MTIQDPVQALKNRLLHRRYQDCQLEAGRPEADGVVFRSGARSVDFYRDVTMSSINSVGGNSPVQKIITNPIKKDIQTQAPPSSNTTDKVELSGMSHLLKALKINDIRTDKVASIRAQIEAGTYETDDKIDAAADKMLDDLLK
jgi:anti-sigma28 factor (negative regulator of flagellin synthesis)